MDKLTIDTYDELAKEYDVETTDFWDKFPRTIFDTFIRSVVPRGRVLDVGSGPGRDGLVLKDAGFEVVCLDASKAMVELSKARGLESILGDFAALPFSDASFDGVWSYTALLHVPKSDVAQPMAEICRVLKPGGIFGLGLIEGDTELYRESSGVGKPRWFSFYRQEEIEKLLHDHGFEVVYFEGFQKHTKRYLNFIARRVSGLS